MLQRLCKASLFSIYAGNRPLKPGCFDTIYTSFMKSWLCSLPLRRVSALPQTCSSGGLTRACSGSHALRTQTHSVLGYLRHINSHRLSAASLQQSLIATRGAHASAGRHTARPTPELQPESQTSEASAQAANLPSYCSGCGVKLQQQQPDTPGYFQLPKRFLEQQQQPPPREDDHVLRQLEEEELRAVLDTTEASSALSQQPTVVLEEEKPQEDFSKPPSRDPNEVDLDAAAKRAAAAIAAARSTASGQQPGAQQPSGAGKKPAQWDPFDDMLEEWTGTPDSSKGFQRQLTPEAKVAIKAEEAAGIPILCTRCYSLTHYGGVKSAAAETQMPAFDLGRKVGNKIAKTPHRRAVLLCVVDVADFDGSLPRSALAACIPKEAWEAASTAPGGSQQQYLEGGFRLVVVANKYDLLPPQVSRTRIERWVRGRCKQGGLPRLSGLHLVSSIKGTGVADLLSSLRKSAGRLGDVWVVGAQNAGKSSLINAMRREAGLSKERNITTASLPGTTLGMLKVEGLMPERCMMFDTPGVPHAHQLTSMLQPDEVKLLLPRKTIRARTFRIGAGHSVLLGGTCRFDVVDVPAATMYLTVWASPEVVTHFGKTDAASERQRVHSGSRLTPPLGNAARIAQLPQPVPTDICVTGDSFRGSGTDIAIAGMGWVGIAVDGTADLRVWALPGVAITTRSSLVPDLAADMQRPGFSSDSGASTTRGQSQGRQQQPRRKKKTSHKRRS